VVHGFLISDTNVNLMLVPGYVSTINTRFSKTGDRLMPCHEYCSVGHEGMWARVKVIDHETFRRMAANRQRLSCAPS
jgi:cytochrome c oxidase subunit 2